MWKHILWIGIFVVNVNANAASDFTVTAESDEIKIGTYNVQNLFDATHDEGKVDYTYLPLSSPLKKTGCPQIKTEYYRKLCFQIDWSPERLKIKLQQIKTALQEQGPMPDALSLVEVENENVLKMLAQTLGYEKYLLTNSKDKRGIDVALLWNPEKLEYIEHEEISLDDVIKFESRNILRVHFHPKAAKANTVFAMYVNHWPAMMAPAKFRMEAAKKLTTKIDEQVKRIGKDRYYMVATGDFNTPDTEIPNAFLHVMYSPFWDNQLYDAQAASEAAKNPMRFKMPPGTYYFNGTESWVKFDRIAASKNLLEGEGPGLVLSSFRIVASSTLMKSVTYVDRSSDFYPLSQLVPKRYYENTDNPDKAGFSDHLPVVVKIKWTPTSKTL